MATLLKNSLWILGNLCVEKFEFKDRMIEANGVQIILNLMQSYLDLFTNKETGLLEVLANAL